MGYEYLGKINCPNDLKQLNTEQLKVLASELRQEITNTVSTNGGHLASNLGIIELTLALHLSFDLPNDSLLFDVGHQCYAHKLITGRFNKFNTLRKKGGLSGFMRPDESEYDAFVTGHSSNSISAACGIAKANTLLGNENYTIAVIGDGALTFSQMPGGLLLAHIAQIHQPGNAHGLLHKIQILPLQIFHQCHRPGFLIVHMHHNARYFPQACLLGGPQSTFPGDQLIVGFHPAHRQGL